jgi:parallel beta-helix repeat protein
MNLSTMKKVFFTFFVCLLASCLILSNVSSVYGQTTVNLPSTKDNGIYSQSGALSTGIGGEIIMGRTNNGALRRALMQFDVSSIPTNAIITNVKVKLQMVRTSSGASDVAMHKMTANWGEGTSNSGTGSGSGQGASATTGDATWSHAFFGSTTWTTPGGDYNSTATATLSVNANGSYIYTGASVVADVQSWVTNGATNFGWIFIGNETSNKTTKHWATKEATVAAERPVLEVTYTTPSTPLNGVYTIGGVGADYPSFTAAANALKTLGVSGPVTFDVAVGTYTEFLNLTAITGANATNRITFNGMDTSMVTLTHNAVGQNSTILFDGADYITVKNIKIISTGTNDAWGIHLFNRADFITIDKCMVVTMQGITSASTNEVGGIIASASTTASSTGGDNCHHLTVSNTRSLGGYWGIRLEGGNSSAVPASLDSNNTIINNIFESNTGFGILLDDQTAFTISGNKVFGAAVASKDGIQIEDSHDFTITANNISSTDYGLYFHDANFDLPAANGQSLIANNMFYSSEDDAVTLDDINNINFFHNTCVSNITTALSAAAGLQINDITTSSIKNNIFYSTNGPAFLSTDAITVVDATVNYNVYHSVIGTIATVGTPTYTTLAAWVAADATSNANSLQGDPLLASIPTDLHTTGSLANDVGDNSVGITTDFDGNTRPLAPSTTVDIGADEYSFSVPLNPMVQFNGVAVSVNENAGTITVELEIANANANATSVNVSVGAASTASSNDYTFTNPTTVTFAAGSSTNQPITITIIDDAIEEILSETIVLKLSNITNNATIGADSVYTLTINPSDLVLTKNLILTALFDGPISGSPKGVEVYVVNNIADLSQFGVGTAQNGGGTNGQEYTFPAVSANAGDILYVSNDTVQFFAFFGIHADFQDAGGSTQAMNFNGDDAVELYEKGQIIDIYGVPTIDGTGTSWEYSDTWVYRNCSTGPDSTVFQIGNWTIAPIDNYDNQTTNAGSPLPMPIGTYSPMCPLYPVAINDIASTTQNNSVTIDVLANDNLPNTLTSLTILMQGTSGTATANGTTDITYVPNVGACGVTDMFSYIICDAVGCDTATVSVAISCPISITNSLILTALYDGPYTGGLPKGVEIYVVNNIADLSVYGIGTAQNGGGTNGQEYTFPAVPATAGTFLYVTNDSTGFANFFGFNANFIDNQGTAGVAAAMNFNGDDAVELYEQGVIIDMFGEPNVDGTGTAWEYLDTWVYRNCATGPDSTFVLGNWTYSPINNFDNAANNASATLPMPVGTYTLVCPQNVVANNDNISVPFNTTTSFNPLANDNIVSPLINAGISAQPSNGTLALNLITQLMDYTPNNGFCGTDVAQYFICDMFGCDTATINFTVACPIPLYNIGDVVSVDANGNPDSLGVACALQGIVYGIDFDGNAGYSFTLIDATDGINIFSFNDVPGGYSVTEGDEIRAEGVIGFYNGLTELIVTSIQLISQGNTLKTPTIVTSLGENTESDLIKIEAVTLVDPTQWNVTGASFNVQVRNATDTITIRIDSDCNIAGQPAPTGWFHVTGIGSQFDASSPFTEEYQIFPRYQSDIELISNTNQANLTNQIRIFPNPTSGFLNIVSEVEMTTIRISNVLGQEVMAIQSPNANQAINVSNLTNGVYIITFITESGAWTEQFIKN